MAPTLNDRFAGCLLGLALGDALGARFEGQSPEHIAKRFKNVRDWGANLEDGELDYTDDTQMMIGVAEALIGFGAIVDEHLCSRFAANYNARRGYGRGARLIIEAMLVGDDHRSLATRHFPGGSFGNGAAMRVAPVGLFFRDYPELLWEQARLSALPTHTHPLGIEGAQLLALATGLVSQSDAIDRVQLFSILSERCSSMEYSGPLRRAAQVTDWRDLALFGNGIEATSSVVTAVAAFALTPDSFEETVSTIIRLGGDTDTIAAMAGALSGAYLGRQGLPSRLLRCLETGRQGRVFIEQLGADLYDAYLKAKTSH
jgi:poly(ADP-ribose) glycohydrolase ARH3